jgi:hypothetical protein
LFPVNTIEEGWKLQAADWGKLLHDNCIVPVYPGAGERFSVSVTLPAWATVREVDAGVTDSTWMGGEADCVKFASPLYCALTTTLPAGKELAV